MTAQGLSGFSEAVVVLANLMDQDGRLNEDSAARLERASTIVRERPDACLITSGWNYRPDSPIMIAHAMRDRACLEHNIASHRIFADCSARDTVGDAVFTKRNLIEPSAIRRLTIVSSGYHMARVQAIFEFVFGGDYVVHYVSTRVDHAQGKQQSEAASLAAFRRTFAGVAASDTEAIHQRLLGDHPLYNGAAHPDARMWARVE